MPLGYFAAAESVSGGPFSLWPLTLRPVQGSVRIPTVPSGRMVM